MGRKTCGIVLFSATVSLIAQAADARLTRIVIEATKAQADGTEIVTGTFYGDLDPRDPHNRIITDIDKAPRTQRARVDYSATFIITRPADAGQRDGLLYYDVPNRGTPLTSVADMAGHVRVMSGWQGDIPPGPSVQTATLPVAKGITGPVLTRLTNIAAETKSAAIAGGIARPTARPVPVSLDTAKAQLVREQRDQPDQVIASTDWAFADCTTTPFPGTPDPARLCLREGFDPNSAYTLTYQGKDPVVLGIGFAATRDLIAYLRSGKPDDSGTANPAGTGIRWAVASGTSQSGNFLRSFVHLGFNADETGHRVFDGINPNIAARQVPLNVRFGVPGGAADRYAPGSEGVLWWGRYTDSIRGRGTASLLDRCTKSATCPKVIETLGSAEFWGLRASAGFVGTGARADIALPDTVRRYYFPSVTHGGAFGGHSGFSTKGDAVPAGCLMRGNPNPSRESLRVAQNALIAWVKEGKAPPASRYPSLAAGDLVAPRAASMGWPAIAGAPVPDGKLNTLLDYDFGQAFLYQDVSGVITRQPPVMRRILPSLVPRVDADGNETSGVRSVFLQVPLGTYTGWNVAIKGYDTGGGCGFAGGFIPFATTRAERETNGDPRLSLEERYRDHAGFVARVKEAVARQQADGWLMADDAARIIADAEASSVLVP